MSVRQRIQLTIDGYTLDTNQLPDNMTGVFSGTVPKP